MDGAMPINSTRMWNACLVMGQILCFPLPLGLISSEIAQMGLSVQRVVILTRFETSFSPQALGGLESAIRSLMVI